MSITVADVANFLESIAPLDRQESYDNSGLIVGSSGELVKGVMVCLDCTEAVLDEAIAKGANLVISHHPPVFYGLKKLTGGNATERIVMKALKNNLVLYAIHTNLDNTLTHGVNERIAHELGLDIDGPLKPLEGRCDPMLGAGLVGYFAAPMDERQFLVRVQTAMKAPVIRHTRLLGHPVRRVAVCGGSGSFLLEDAKKAGVEALLTADFKYHQFFDADGDILICDIGHFESEQFTINLLQELISGNFTTFAAHCTEANTNPIHYFT